MTTETAVTFTEVMRAQQSIQFQQFITVGTTPYRVFIKRDAYDEQSYGKVQMFTNANGWIDILNVGINQLPNSYDISYVSMPREVDNPLYLEKQATVRSAMELDATRILRIALEILGK